jgi:hypothetical protein
MLRQHQEYAAILLSVPFEIMLVNNIKVCVLTRVCYKVPSHANKLHVYSPIKQKGRPETRGRPGQANNVVPPKVNILEAF